MIYYAHSKKIYETKREKQELKWLRKRFGRVIVDPNHDMGCFNNIEPYLDKVDECTQVICSEYKRHIGFGIFTEIEFAFKKKKAVRCLRKKLGRFYLVKVKAVEVIDRYDWGIRYGKVIIDKAKKRVS